MLNKFLVVIVLGLFTALAPIDAQTSPSAPARVKGRIVAARVQGHVEAITKADGHVRVLKDGDLLSEQTQVVTAHGASVVLAFSNGASVNVAADSLLDIEQFEQDPFAEPVKFSDLKAEQGTSVTKLNLTRGQLVGKVVHLNIEKGSEFTVQTPVGAAGIRGTTFMITFTPGPNGKAFFQVTTTDGTVVFSGTTSGPVNIPAGKQVVATFSYTPPTAATATTPATPAVITPVTLVATDTSPTEAAQVQAVSQAIVVATEAIVVSTTTTTTTTTPPTTTNTPSQPVVVPPQTTSQAGNH